MTAGTGGGKVARWAPGTQILWRYRANGGREPHICRPVTVVRDSPGLLAVWLASGTPCVRPVMADGSPLHREPLATRYVRPRTLSLTRWQGPGLLKLAVPGEAWSVWLFWEADWTFRHFYVNFEEPHARWEGGVDSEDHFLDLDVYPDRTWRWRDEDEFAAARAVGLVDDALAADVRAAGRAALAGVRAWGSPYGDGWEDWRPEESWPVPALPDDWARAPAPSPGAPPSPRTPSPGAPSSGAPEDLPGDPRGERCGDRHR